MPQPGKIQDVYWLENLSDARSVFKGNAGAFNLEANGYVGSIQEVPRAVAFDPFVKRAEARGKIRVLQPKEALERMEGLQIRETSETIRSSHLMKALDHGAAEATGRFVDGKDLPDEAEARPSVSFRDIWDNERGASVRQNNRSTDTEPPARQAHAPVVDGLNVVLTEPVHEGEWESHTG